MLCLFRQKGVGFLRKIIARLIIFIVIFTMMPFAEVTAESEISKVFDEGTYVKSLLGDSVVLTGYADTVFTNGEKSTYSEISADAYMEENVLMASTSVFSSVLGTQVAVSGDSITISGTVFTVGSTSYTADGNSLTLPKAPAKINGVIYLPVAEICRKVLGKDVYEDDRAFVVIADEEIVLEDAETANSCLEDSDFIWRYMQFDRPLGEEIISAKRASRPRILTTAERLGEVKGKLTEEPYKSWLSELTIKADEYVATPVTERVMQDSIRLLDACKKTADIMITMSVAYLVTDKTEYAERGILEMLNVCNNWSDWNINSQFLDSGFLAQGLGIAYDSLHGKMESDERAQIRAKTKELYFDFSKEMYIKESANIKRSYGTVNESSNWTAVCNSGILLTALAMADEGDSVTDPVCETLITNAIRALEHPMTGLEADGGWSEGLSYWAYTFNSLTNSIGALLNMTGNDYGFLSAKGYLETVNFPMYIQTPATGGYNYSEQGYNYWSYIAPSQGYYYALLTDNADLSKVWYDFKQKKNIAFEPTDILWYKSGGTNDVSYENEKYFRGVGVAQMRGDYEDEYASFVGISSGKNTAYGSHFDKGSFVFDALGERWAIDLGTDNYNISGGYFGENGFTLYKKRTEGHNCVVINPDSGPGQELNKSAKLEKYGYGRKSSFMILNLTDVYGTDVTTYKRGFKLDDNKTTLTVRDEISLSQDNSSIYWFMHTLADDVSINNEEKTAVITIDGKKLLVEFLIDGAELTLEERDTTNLDPSMVRDDENSREGITKLTLYGTASDDVAITAKFIPLWEAEPAEGVSGDSLSVWSADNRAKSRRMYFTDYSGDSVIYDTDSIPIRFYAEKGFESIEVYANKTKIAEMTEENDSNIYQAELVTENIPKSDIMLLKLVGKYPEGEFVKQIMPMVYKKTTENVLAQSNFNSLAGGELTASNVKTSAGLNYVLGDSVILTRSTGTEVYALCTEMEAGEKSFVQHSVNVDDGKAVTVSFDAKFSKKGLGSTLSFTGTDNVAYPEHVRIVGNNGLTPDEAKIGYGNWYKVSLFMNTEKNIGTVTIRNSNGKIVSRNDVELVGNGVKTVRLNYNASEDMLEEGTVEIDNFDVKQFEFGYADSNIEDSSFVIASDDGFYNGTIDSNNFYGDIPSLGIKPNRNPLRVSFLKFDLTDIKLNLKRGASIKNAYVRVYLKGGAQANETQLTEADLKLAMYRQSDDDWKEDGSILPQVVTYEKINTISETVTIPAGSGRTENADGSVCYPYYDFNITEALKSEADRVGDYYLSLEAGHRQWAGNSYYLFSKDAQTAKENGYEPKLYVSYNESKAVQIKDVSLYSQEYNRLGSMSVLANTLGDTTVKSTDISQGLKQALSDNNGTVSVKIMAESQTDSSAFLQIWGGSASQRPTIEICYKDGSNESFKATLNTYVRGGINSGTSYGSVHPYIQGTDTASNSTRFVFLKFDVSSALSKINNIESAQLSVTLKSASNAGFELGLYEIFDNNWDISSISMDNRPSYTKARTLSDEPKPGQNELSFKIKNVGIYGAESEVILAIYSISESGIYQLEKTQSIQKDIEKNAEVDMSFEFILPETKRYIAKIIVVDDYDSLKPLCNYYILQSN